VPASSGVEIKKAAEKPVTSRLPSAYCLLLSAFFPPPAFGDVRRGWYHVRLFEVIIFD
jgi:hypothetical protein